MHWPSQHDEIYLRLLRRPQDFAPSRAVAESHLQFGTFAADVPRQLGKPLARPMFPKDLRVLMLWSNLLHRAVLREILHHVQQGEPPTAAPAESGGAGAGLSTIFVQGGCADNMSIVRHGSGYRPRREAVRFRSANSQLTRFQ